MSTAMNYNTVNNSFVDANEIFQFGKINKKIYNDFLPDSKLITIDPTVEQVFKNNNVSEQILNFIKLSKCCDLRISEDDFEIHKNHILVKMLQTKFIKVEEFLKEIA